MKKYLTLIIISLLLCSNVYAKWKYKPGDIVEGEVVFGKKDAFLLPPGKFVVAVNSREKEFKDLMLYQIDNETGYLFMPKDVEDLTKKLKNSIDSEIYKQPETIKSCINHIKENFTKIRMCDETIKFYKTVLDK